MAADKVSIMQVISGLDIGGGHGGAERFGLELSRHLDKDNFNIQICAFWKRYTGAETYWLDILKSEGIAVTFAADWKGKFKLGAYLRGVMNLLDICKKSNVDLLHSHFQMGTLASLMVKFLGGARKVIRTAHITLEWGEGMVAWLLRQTATKWLFPILVDLEVGVSKAVTSQLNKHPGARFSKHSPQLIYNAIHLDDFQPRTMPHSWDILFPEDALIVGSVGRLSRQKGYEFLIRAIPEVLNTCHTAFFVLIGDGELRPELEELVKKLGVQERVLFLGTVEDILPYLYRMDLFVLPSLWEGLPTVIMESMACGIPVIATDIPGTRELIQNQVNGWLVPPENSKTIAEVIVNVLRDPTARNRMVDQGEKMVQKFNIQFISEAYKKVYIDLLRGSSFIQVDYPS